MRVLSRNRIIAAMVAFAVFIAALCTYSTNVSASNTSRTYYVFDALTGGTKIREYTLNSLAEYDYTRGVFGEDDRTFDPSKNGVVYIMTLTGNGTGFIVDDHTIATAAHCVYSSLIGGTRIDKIYLLNNIGTRSTTVTPVEYHVPLEYISNNPIGSVTTVPGYDYALITVEEDLSDYPHFNLGVALDTITNQNHTLKVTGFPSVVDDQNVNGSGIFPMIFTSTGSVERMDSLFIYTYTDYSKGNSGGPVYIEEQRGGNSYLTAIGIVSVTQENIETEEPIINMVSRLTTDELHFYYNNSNLIFTREE